MTRTNDPILQLAPATAVVTSASRATRPERDAERGVPLAKTIGFTADS